VNECADVFLMMTSCECVMAADSAMKLKFCLPMSSCTATDCRDLPLPETRSSPNTTLLPSIAETTGASSTSTGIRLSAVSHSLSLPLSYCSHRPDTQSSFFPLGWKPYLVPWPGRVQHRQHSPPPAGSSPEQMILLLYQTPSANRQYPGISGERKRPQQN
jgi:hypothetical protein